MSNLNKMRRELFEITRTQRENAWNEKDFKKSMSLREKEQENYEKLKLLNGIIKANEKERKNGKNGKK